MAPPLTYNSYKKKKNKQVLQFGSPAVRDACDGLDVEGVLAGELDLDGADVLADAAEVLADALPAGVDLLRVDAVLGVEVLHLAVGEDAVELVVDLVLGAQPGAERQALLLARQLQEVGPLPHDGGAARGHLEHLLLRGRPRDDVELLHLRLAEQPARAAAEDRRRRVGVQLRGHEPLGRLLGHRLLGGRAERGRPAGGRRRRHRELRAQLPWLRPGGGQQVARGGGGLRGHGHGRCFLEGTRKDRASESSKRRVLDGGRREHAAKRTRAGGGRDRGWRSG